MCEKGNIRSGLLAFLLAMCVVTGLLNPVAFAAELEEGQSSEAGTEGTQTDTAVEETIPDEHIFLQWNVDSALTYRLDEDNYVWTIYDADGNEMTNSSGAPASAGYELTGSGDWFGSAVVKLTIVNNLTVVAKMQLLFMNDLSAAALEISSTLESEDENVTYDSESGLLVVQPNAEGEVTMTISAEALQKAGVTITKENSIAGWIQVQVVSPAEAPEEDARQISQEVTVETSDEATEETIEEITEETTEVPTEVSTDETAEEPTTEIVEIQVETNSEEQTGG